MFWSTRKHEYTPSKNILKIWKICVLSYLVIIYFLYFRTDAIIGPSNFQTPWKVVY